ncbi:MAG TPA: M15 family metallopeptidase [Baekduia sp.]|uniref:M15 family metallopeptidase n=1 Tax=Baekduia sp. TaxID=2600305 RepID=UPI002D77B1CC|nr:M15 family metallopeptidase [Baekduia sp.]HET6510108.1 M15 family metallopeptidase [Baekduia sp.]
MLTARVLAAGLLGCATASCGGGAGDDAPSRATVTDAVAAATTTTTAAARPATTRAAFAFSARRLTPALRHRLNGASWHPGCPVALDDLRYVRVAYVGFDGRAHRGELVVNADAVHATRTAFAYLYAERFPIRRMRLVDDYGASDYRSIEADNTSAFNCRRATGATRWSQHAYGRAIDVNTIENPYVYANGTTTHARSRPYLDRSRHRKGMAYAGGVLVRAFAKAGWSWGGTWPGPTDYQHFSANGT